MVLLSPSTVNTRHSLPLVRSTATAHSTPRLTLSHSPSHPSQHHAFHTIKSSLYIFIHRSDLFAVCAVYAIIVMYDACHVRREAGRHAVALNLLLAGDPPGAMGGEGRGRGAMDLEAGGGGRASAGLQVRGMGYE